MGGYPFLGFPSIRSFDNYNTAKTGSGQIRMHRSIWLIRSDDLYRGQAVKDRSGVLNLVWLFIYSMLAGESDETSALVVTYNKMSCISIQTWKAEDTHEELKVKC
jgi:hypothetical protein